jgi:hypothetical protein
MILPYYLLSNDLRSRNIIVDVKDLNYQVLDSSISDRFVRAIRCSTVRVIKTKTLYLVNSILLGIV